MHMPVLDANPHTYTSAHPSTYTNAHKYAYKSAYTYKYIMSYIYIYITYIYIDTGMYACHISYDIPHRISYITYIMYHIHIYHIHRHNVHIQMNTLVVETLA